MKKISYKSMATIYSYGGLDSTATNFYNFIPVLVVEPNEYARLSFFNNVNPSKIVEDRRDLNITYEEYLEKATFQKPKWENIPDLTQNEAQLLRINLDPIFLFNISSKVKNKTKFINKMAKRILFTREESQQIYKSIDFISQARPQNIIIENHYYFTRALDNNGNRFVDVIRNRLKYFGYNVMVDERYYRPEDKEKLYRFDTANFGEPQSKKLTLIMASKTKTLKIPAYQKKVDFGKYLDYANRNGDTSDSPTNTSVLTELKNKPIGVWFRRKENQHKSTHILRFDGKSQTTFMGNLTWWKIYRIKKFTKTSPKIVNTVFDNEGNSLLRRLSIPESIILFSAWKYKRVPKIPMLEERKIIGFGKHNRFLSCFLQQIINKTERRQWKEYFSEFHKQLRLSTFLN